MAALNVATAAVRERATPNVSTSAVIPGLQAGAVSWSAILAGAAAAAALSLILLIMGTGLGLSSVSPWAQDGITAATLGISTILWLTFTQVMASGMGGYLAGRLRTRWVETHSDEVYFRDTAHGLLTWAVASLATAALLTTVISSIVGGGVRAGAVAAGGAATAATAAVAAGAEDVSMGYLMDSLFRRDGNAVSAEGTMPSGNTAPQNALPPANEVARIFMNAMRSGTLPPADLAYAGQLVAQRTSLTPQEAEKRVTEIYARAQATLRDAETAAREAADKARKASAYAAMWIVISMLIGAFIASYAATIGGRQRDI